MVLTGCASHYSVVAPDLHDRAKQITRLAVVPTEVRMSRHGLGRDEVMEEWSETARANLMNAIAQHFGSGADFKVVAFAPTEVSEATQQELDGARSEMRAIVPNRIAKGVACIPGPAPALAEATGAEALLLVYANDYVTTTGTIVVLITLAVVLAPLFIFPFSWPYLIKEATEPAPEMRLAIRKAVTLCLIDARTGEVIWFDYRGLGAESLLETSKAERLMSDAYAKFREAAKK